MHRRLVTITFVLLVTLGQPRTADAGFWAWLEKWSGPGPFRARPFETLVLTMCLQDTRDLRPANLQTLEPVVRWRKRWLLKPSPIARNDTFHQLQWEVAQLLSASTPAEQTVYYRRLLNNPAISTFARAAYTANAMVVVPQAAGPQSSPTVAPAGEAAPAASIPQGTEPLTGFSGSNARTYIELYRQGETELGPGHQHGSLVCGYFDVGSFRADEDPSRGFPAVRARLIDGGPSARVHDGVDIGGGFGAVFFSGSGVSVTRATFTPLRVVLRPIVIGVPDHLRKEWMGVLSFYWKETYVMGLLTGADFGVPENPWSEDGELVRSFGFTLDFTALVPTVANLFRGRD